MSMFSVIITHYNRLENLRNTLKGLGRQSLVPFEVIIVEMGEGLELHETFPFSLKIIDYEHSWTFMPLAAARNLGAELAQTDHLIFLDVDCIPSHTFCEQMFVACSEKDALIMGSPRYLLSNGIENAETKLKDNSILHPSRPKVDGLRLEKCYEVFWSLCFSIPKEQFEYMGGFDDRYVGYGAEDTDFALEVKMAGIAFYLSEAEVYHQQHPIFVPPLNHLEAIVKNSNIFYSKWDYWPMVDCLSDFTSMGYIAWKEKSDFPIILLNKPTADEVKSRLIKNAPYR
ncbi:hypothetical protein LCGC14_1992520 [marine sediment metagenome]|uniref:Glycosyltransferase n=2 Tax=root TaxID=1 RepID=A0A831QQP8_9FLAO|nr:glycosyltransferase [Pricia antarctica]